MLLSSLVPNAANGKSKTDATADGNGDVPVDMDASEENFGDKRAAAKRRKLSSEPELDVDETAATVAHIKTEPANQREREQEPVNQAESIPVPIPIPTATTVAVAAATVAATAVVADVEEDDDCMLLPLPKAAMPILMAIRA